MLQSFGLAFDWHPLGNSIRLTGAAYNNRNALSIGAKGELGLGDGDLLRQHGRRDGFQ